MDLTDNRAQSGLVYQNLLRHGGGAADIQSASCVEKTRPKVAMASKRENQQRIEPKGAADISVQQVVHRSQ